MFSPLIILFLLSLFLLPLFLAESGNTGGDGRIRSDLTGRNMRVVDISRRTRYLFHQGPAKYEVSYITPENQLYKVNCVVWPGGELFWGDAEFVRQITAVEVEQLVLRRNGYGADSAEYIILGKEAIIDGLTSGSERERLWMVRQVRRLKEVDELVFFILQDMCIDDPVLAVRKAARETVKIIS